MLPAPAVVAALLGESTSGQNTVFSTHDWSIVPGVEVVREAWADVKMPGGFPVTAVPGAVPSPFDTRYTFAVGTIEVNDTQPGALFSAAPALVGLNGPPTFGPPTSVNMRQVVMLQVNDAVMNFNGPQRFFYGQTQGDLTRATNTGRGISVWRGPLNVANGVLDADDRIAICGETYDQALPASQAPFPGGWLASTATSPSGFQCPLVGFLETSV